MSNIKYCIRIGILFLAGIIVFGCNEDRQNEKDSDIFQINIPLTSGDKPLFADSLFCGKEIVPLETTPECLISQIDKLEIADDKLYLLDDEQDFIFIFSNFMINHFFNFICKLFFTTCKFYHWIIFNFW